MAAPTFSAERFREQFPAYASIQRYPDEILQGWWDAAICYLPEYCECNNLECCEVMYYLMAAHLLYLSQRAAQGQAGMLASASIDKVSVSVVTPPALNMWQWWMSGSPYGVRLWALLHRRASGGGFVGGSPVRRSMRGTWR